MILNPSVGWSLFWLGLASGIALLPVTASRWVSPRWLKWLLVASTLLVISRYVTIALWVTRPDPPAWWGLQRCWFGTSLGLTLLLAVALDQLVRHPAMSPRKLLRWLSPFLAAYAVVLLVGRLDVVPDPSLGFRPRLVGWTPWVFAATVVGFMTGFLVISAQVVAKVPVRRIRLAVVGLMAASFLLGVVAICDGVGRASLGPALSLELLAFVALWHAYETARALQQGSA